MTRRRLQKYTRADRTFFGIRPADEEPPRRRVKIDDNRELLDLACKAAAYAELLTGCNLADVSRDAANHARADVRDAIEVLQAFERRLMKRIEEGLADV